MKPQSQWLGNFHRNDYEIGQVNQMDLESWALCYGSRDRGHPEADALPST